MIVSRRKRTASHKLRTAKNEPYIWPSRSWPNSAWGGIPRRSNMGGSRRRGRAGRPARPRRLRLLLHERAAALIERTEGLLGGDGRQRGKIIPFVLRFVRRVHLHQEHVVHVPAVFADRAFAEIKILCRDRKSG